MYGPAACIFFGEEIGAVERSEGTQWVQSFFKLHSNFYIATKKRLVLVKETVSVGE